MAGPVKQGAIRQYSLRRAKSVLVGRRLIPSDAHLMFHHSCRLYTARCGEGTGQGIHEQQWELLERDGWGPGGKARSERDIALSAKVLSELGLPFPASSPV